MNDLSLDKLKALRQYQEDYYADLIRALLKRKRDYLVHALVCRLRQIGFESRVASTVVEPHADDTAGWVAIDSLSGLRSVVGGRFQNLKKRWVDAGFPLKEHRGDRQLEYEIDQAGWVELSNWIFKQGYESRLAKGQTEFVFELRKIQD